MISGSARSAVLAGLLIGLTVLAGAIGAGVDFVAGNQGWWMVLGLVGLMAGASIDAVLIEQRRRPRPALPRRTAEARPR
jgi:ABC-type multidrug transport system permease subunit